MTPLTNQNMQQKHHFCTMGYSAPMLTHAKLRTKSSTYIASGEGNSHSMNGFKGTSAEIQGFHPPKLWVSWRLSLEPIH